MYKQVVVIAHQAIGMGRDPVDLAYLSEQLQEALALGVRAKDHAAPRAAIHHMVPSAGVLNTLGARHAHKPNVGKANMSNIKLRPLRNIWST